MCSRSHRACFRSSAGFWAASAAVCMAVSNAFVCQLRYKRAFFLIFHNLSQVSCRGTIASLVTRARVCAGRGTHPASAWFSPSLVEVHLTAAAALVSLPLSAPFFKKQVFFLSKRGVFSGVRAVFSGCLVGVSEAWEGPFSGPLPFGGPEPGPSERSASPVLSPFAPKATGPAARAAPPGAAILQHHLYAASALAADERARPGWTGRARAHSLRELGQTSPEAAPRRGPGPPVR